MKMHPPRYLPLGNTAVQRRALENLARTIAPDRCNGWLDRTRRTAKQTHGPKENES
jgi:hypothetical protein